MSKVKADIIKLFYKKHLKCKEIANVLNISTAYVTKIIKLDDRYVEEKVFRKNISKDKRKKSQKDFVKNKRENKQLEDNYAVVQYQHRQAVRELSKGSYLTNESYRKFNNSAYKYNPSKCRYEFDENLGRSYAVPKYIKER